MEIIDPYAAPEFFFTHLPKIEPAGGGCLRFHCCVRRGEIFEVRFYCVVPAQLVTPMATESARAAAHMTDGPIRLVAN